MRSPLYGLLVIFSAGLLLGSLFLLFSSIPKENSRNSTAKNLPQAQTITSDEVVYAGKVLEGGDRSGLAKYRLVDDQGRPITFLVSNQIDLSILQSALKVEVSGRKEKILEGNIPLVRVERLNFR